MTSPVRRASHIALLALMVVLAPSSWSQAPESPAVLMAKQREAMAQLSFMDGAWRGSAWNVDPTGKRHEVTQTERVGSFLDGTVRVIEGRGYNTEGTAGFQALAVLSYDLNKKAWVMRSWAQGRTGEFAFVPTADGFVWTVPAGPNATVRYTAVIKGDTWREIGEYIKEGSEPRQVFEMNVRRIGSSQWPEDGAIPMK